MIVAPIMFSGVGNQSFRDYAPMPISPPLRPDQGKCELTEIAQQIDSCQRECALNDAEKYEEMLNFGLVEVVYEWSRGMVSRRASEHGHTAKTIWF